MPGDHTSDSNPSSPESSGSEGQPNASGSGKKKLAKVAKPRLTATQKNTNHKDAENKRRTAIRERFTELSHMVPGTVGQERSEQVMLSKTTDFLKDMISEQRQLEVLAQAQGIRLDENERIKDNDYGGPHWRPKNMEAYEASKAKKVVGGSHAAEQADGDDD